MKVAIIGTGGAAFGTVMGLVAGGHKGTLHFFDAGPAAAEPAFSTRHPGDWTPAEMAEVARGPRRQHGWQPVPAYSHFGEAIPYHPVSGGPGLFKSRARGGLTRYWSASLFNFTQPDFADWPISATELAPFYAAIADFIGISGASDGLGTLFGDAYVNRAPIVQHPGLAALGRDLGAGAGPYVVAGANRLGIDTAPDSPRGCVYCGECYSGCFRRAIFNAHDGIERALGGARPEIAGEAVVRLETGPAGISVVTATERYRGYDRVFLAAGCIATSEIVLRSIGQLETPLTLLDNPMFVFPLLGRPNRDANGEREDADAYMAIANTIAGLLPRDASEHYAHFMIAPLPGMLLRNFLPPALWGAAGSLSRRLRRRVAFGKLSLHSDFGHRYALSLDADAALRIEKLPRPETARRVADARRRFTEALRATRFSTLPLPWMETPTGGHYVGSLAYGNDRVPIGRDGAVMPGVHICDSAAFPHAPAQPLTFTIMANAMRTAREALDG